MTSTPRHSVSVAAADEAGCRVAVDIDAGGVVAFVVDRVTSLDAR